MNSLGRAPFVIAVLLFICSLAPSSLPAITVTPGTASSFDIKVPATARAGAEFEVTLRVVDGEGNLVRNYSEQDRTVVLSTTGTGTLSKTSLNSSEFQNGSARITVSYSRAEEIRIRAREQDHVASGQSESFLIRPGPPQRFQLETPSRVRAGSPFSVSLTVVDRNGNRLRQYATATNGIVLSSTGVDTPTPDFVPAEQFHDGRLQTRVTYNTAETIRLVVRDRVNNLRVQSEPIQVVPGGLAGFQVSVPREVTAGQPFQAAVEAVDSYGNIIRDYARQGGGVELHSSGSGELDPSFLSPDRFDTGVAFVELTYPKAETMQLQARDRRLPVTGQSNPVTVNAGPPASFGVSVPSEVQAGEEFQVRITALDPYDNRLTDYSSRGTSVTIQPSSESDVSMTVSASDFQDGRASVAMSLTRAGRTRVRAAASQGQTTGLSDVVVVSPGPPGAIGVQAPDRAIAGENFSVTLQLRDAYGNPLRQTTQLGGNINVFVTGRAEETHSTVDPEQLIQGQTSVSFRHETAEDITIGARWNRYDVSSTSSSVSIQPGPFDHVAIRAPGDVRAGQEFQLGFQLRDAYGNPIQEVPRGTVPFRLRSTGSGDLNPTYLSRSDISTPSFTVPVQYFVAESVAVEVRSPDGRTLGISRPIQVQPGPLASFDIETPGSVSAAERFLVRIKAQDAYMNTIRNLDQRQGTVSLSAVDGGDLTPSRIQYRDFIQGVAEVLVQYRQAGNLRIRAGSSDIRARSNPIRVRPGPPSEVTITTTDSVQAGKPFRATIRVADRHGNQIQDLPGDFSGVRLSAGGEGRVHPAKISRGQFEDGVAQPYLIYPRTGSLSIEASVLEQELRYPIVDRIFLDREQQSARLYLVGSDAMNTRVQEAGQGTPLQIQVQPAQLEAPEQSVSFSNWFVKKIQQQQAMFEPLPSVLLRIYPQARVEVTSQTDNNLVTVTLRSEGQPAPPAPEEVPEPPPPPTETEEPPADGEPSPEDPASAEPEPQETEPRTDVPSLDDVRLLIQLQEFERAQQSLNRYREQNPNDPEAQRLQERLDRLRRIFSP